MGICLKFDDVKHHNFASSLIHLQWRSQGGRRAVYPKFIIKFFLLITSYGFLFLLGCRLATTMSPIIPLVTLPHYYHIHPPAPHPSSHHPLLPTSPPSTTPHRSSYKQKSWLRHCTFSLHSRLFSRTTLMTFGIHVQQYTM